MPKRHSVKPDASRRTFLQKAVAGAGATAAAALGGAPALAARDDSAECGERRSADSRPGRVCGGIGGRSDPLRVSDDRRASVRARVQGGRRRRALRLSRQLSRRARAGHGRHSGVRRPPRRLDGACGRRVHSRHRRDRRRVGHRGPGFYRHDLRDRLRQRRAHAAARRRQQHVDRAGRHRVGHSARVSAADDGRPEEIRQAVDHSAARARVHRLRVPALKSGVPGPVHLDFPSEVAAARFKDATELESFYDKTRYRTDSRPHPSPKDIATAIDMIRKAERPIIVSSNGVFYAKAWDALKRFAEKAQIPVVESGAMKGQFSDASPLSANASPTALASADLVILVGPALHADGGRVRLRARRALHPHRPGPRRHRPQPADRPRHRQLRAGGARGAGRRRAGDEARCVGRRDRGGTQAIRRAERRVLQDGPGLHRCDSPGRDREGAGGLSVSRHVAERADDDRLWRLRHRAVRPPRAARVTGPARS